MNGIRPGPLPGGTAATAASHAVARPGPLDSVALLAGGNEVLIRHGTETYRLRLTRQNRLILTK
jgi:hemin uptake protein HemP